MPQKASTPWSSRTVAEGGTDSPVGSLVPVPDEITPVVNTGFIATTGKFTGLPANDLQFTFQDPYQALAAGASLYIEGINTLRYEILILGVLDSSGNNINVDLSLDAPTVLLGPYNSSAFENPGVAGNWRVNSYPGGGGGGGMENILYDTNENLAATWRFWKIIGVRGLVSTILVRSNEGSDAGTISTAYLRLV